MSNGNIFHLEKIRMLESETVILSRLNREQKYREAIEKADHASGCAYFMDFNIPELEYRGKCDCFKSVLEGK